MVLDADALNIIAADENLKQLLGKNHVLTPHMGEMSRLIAQPVSRISVDMPACARSFSDRFSCVLVLKDACTLVSGGDQLYVNTCGNSGMATGGSGDVLSGVIGALLAGGQLTGFEAASYGVLMHALAGDRAAEELGERAVDGFRYCTEDTMKYCKRVTARVHLDAIRQNISNICRGIPQNTKVCAVVKADGYGHGATAIAQALDDTVDFFAVATVSEAVDLRAGAVKKPILILGYAWPEDYEELIEKDVRFTVFKEKDAKELSELGERMGKKALIHIKVDTGMNRIGFPVDDEAVETVRRIRTLPGVEVEGIFTHFARADEEDKTYAYEQLRLFQDFIRRVEKDADRIPIHHCANSAASMEMPEAFMDMVRLGIAMYGLYPSDEVSHEILNCTPALELKSQVVYVKDVEAGRGNQLQPYPRILTDGKRRVATVPVGYGDGYPRLLSDTAAMC